jgi:hypothetical protein
VNTRSIFRPLALPLALALAVLLLWNTFLVYPLKIFVVFLHELSHGLAAIMTGGSIERIELTFDQGGVCLTRGGSAFIILSAGYLGSALWGALLLVLSSRTRWSRILVLGIGILTLAITIFYVRSLFGFLYGIASGAALVVAGQKLPQKHCELLVKVIGITSCLYAIYDIISDVFSNNLRQSDAHALAELTGIPSFIWGVLWILISALISGLALVITASRTSSANQLRL